MNETTQSTRSALAIVSVLLLAAAISGASLIRAESTGQSRQAHSFIGTAPEAAAVEVPAPTF